MADDLSIQILNQTTESIQKLFDLSTRIDERVKNLQICETNAKESINILKKELSDVSLKLLLIQEKDQNEEIGKQVQQCQLALLEIDKKINTSLTELDRRVGIIESSQQGSVNRWEKISTFAIQLIWVVIAAWVLASLGLQPPP